MNIFIEIRGIYANQSFGLIIEVDNSTKLYDLLSAGPQTDNNLMKGKQMEPIKVIARYKKISELVMEGRIKYSLDQMKEFVLNSSNADHKNQLENLEMTYRNMISYTAGGIHDPERKKIYTRLQQSIMKLADMTRQDILAHYSGWNTYWLKTNNERERKLAGKSLVESLDDLIFKSDLDEWLKLSGTRFSDPEAEIAVRHRKLIEDIFNHLWLTDNYGDAEEELLDIISNGSKFTWYEKSLFVSAVTLSTFRVWDKKKVFSMISFYEKGEARIRERALAGLVLVLHYYNNRLTLHPDLLSHLQELFSSREAREHLRITIMQTLRSRETERIGRKLQDEILPKVAHLRPRIEEKLDLDKLLPEDLIEGKNPDWSDMFEESEDIYKTMEELSKLQMEGADVYMSAFSNLKNFDFFRIFSNWFMPFYPDHEAIEDIFRDDVLNEGTNEVAEALYKTPFICNSDKYSLVLNLKHLPDAQKKMMLKVFRMELEGLEQMKDQEIDLDPNLTFRTNITQYLQDLYRFFKLSPYKNEFEDQFRGRLDIQNSYFFRKIFDSKEDIMTLADYYFGKDFYTEALDIYIGIAESVTDDPQLFEKTGYCYQQEGDWEMALKMYNMSDILERKVWTLKKKGYCLRRLKRYDEALLHYLDSEAIEPENMHTIAMIGHCYLDMKDYESALKYYFKVEYEDPDNFRVLKPIAWCYFATGKFEQSKKYWDKLASGKLTAHDLINMGHLALCTGERADAIDLYRRSISEGDISGSSFLEILDEDRELLVRLGIDPDDIPIISDFLLYNLDQE